MLAELSQFYMFPRSHGNILFLQNENRNQEIKKRVVSVSVGRFSLFCENRQFRFSEAGFENRTGLQIFFKKSG
jgi:hypothetical protein